MKLVKIRTNDDKSCLESADNIIINRLVKEKICYELKINSIKNKVLHICESCKNNKLKENQCKYCDYHNILELINKEVKFAY